MTETSIMTSIVFTLGPFPRQLRTPPCGVHRLQWRSWDPGERRNVRFGEGVGRPKIMGDFDRDLPSK